MKESENKFLRESSWLEAHLSPNDRKNVRDRNDRPKKPERKLKGNCRKTNQHHLPARGIQS